MYPHIVLRIVRRLRGLQETDVCNDCDKNHAETKSAQRQISSTAKHSLVILSNEPTAPFKSGSQIVPRAAGKALVVSTDHRYRLDSGWPFPQIQNPHEVVIKVQAVGLNPIDWKSIAYQFCLPRLPWITGREAAGVIESVGSAVSDVHVGQRVWTSTYYKDIRAGCFQERIVVPAHTVLPVPPTVSLEEAATLGVAALTATMVLWKWLGLSMPQTAASCSLAESSMIPHSTAQNHISAKWLLVWGGSTATGQYVTQLAALSDVRTITVCSAATQALSYSLGATHVVCRDKKSTQEIVKEVRAIAGDGVGWAVDLVGEETSTACLAVVSRTMPVRFAPLAAFPRKYKAAENVELVNVEMKQFVLDSANRTFADTLNHLVATKQLRTPKLQVLEGGLSMVPEGLTMVREGGLGGKKVVVKL